MSRKIIVALIVTSMAGCADAPVEDGQESLSAEEPGSNTEGSSGPTSAIDGDVGEPLATNYEAPEGEPVYVADLPQSKSLSGSYQDVTAGSGEEAFVNLQQDSLVVGIGGRVDKDNLTTLWVHARQHRPDGFLGPITEFRAGTEPNHSLEVWCAAPPGFVVVGLGSRIAKDNDGDWTTLHLYTRLYNPFSRRLVGQIYERRCGTQPDEGLELRIVSNEVLPDNMLDRAVMNGVGLRCNDHNTEGMRVRYRQMQ